MTTHSVAHDKVELFDFEKHLSRREKFKSINYRRKIAAGLFGISLGISMTGFSYKVIKIVEKENQIDDARQEALSSNDPQIVHDARVEISDLNSQVPYLVVECLQLFAGYNLACFGIMSMLNPPSQRD